MKYYRSGKRRAIAVLSAVSVGAATVIGSVSLSRNMDVQAASSRSEGAIHDIFPESYWAGLDALQAKHPNWTFVAFNTGLSWSDCFAPSDKAYEHEMQLARNLVPNYGYPTSWYSTEVEGAFNWTQNQWEILSAPYWIQASEEAVAYCMDPRNFFNEEQIFQFEEQTYSSYQTVEGVQAILSSGGSYWTQSGQASDLYYENGSDRVYLTYAEAFVKIGSELGISPYILASRVIQEQGAGTSPLISGTKEFTLPDGTTINGGYYNYFNMDATDGGNVGYEQIYQNGLREAYNNGWNTRYKSLYGGAKKLAEKFLKRGQDTFYFQKFNVDSSSNRLFWGQYMQNILAPQSEARNTVRAYQNAGGLDNAFVFVIPVFSDMPASNPYPTKDGNPNYKLSSIIVGNQLVPGFNMDTTEYSMSASGTDSVYVYITAYADTTTIDVNGVSQTGTFRGSVPVTNGSNILTVTATAENGDSRVYRVNLTWEEQSSGGGNGSGSYEINGYRTNGNYISMVEPGTTVSAFKSHFALSGNASVVVSDDSGASYAEDALIRTGSNVTIFSGQDVIGQYRVIIYGDISGDGSIDIVDFAYMKSKMLGKLELSALHKEAADIDGSGSVDIVDFAYMKSKMLGMLEISQH
ncbi:MAG TPA: cadherin-like beta sandwich domain-containing protein [Candidatus Fimimorpha excrementavium]|nr:cadherin-like beta sandwich domain-containing protein [Candidatus Fimimorpha excrementavium]